VISGFIHHYLPNLLVVFFPRKIFHNNVRPLYSVFQSDLNKQFNFYPDKIFQLIDGHILKRVVKSSTLNLFLPSAQKIYTSENV
jgi:S-adenosylmethionine:diacylglycerol 3-amino-3-carboxypropyl transferase